VKSGAGSPGASRSSVMGSCSFADGGLAVPAVPVAPTLPGADHRPASYGASEAVVLTTSDLGGM